MKKIIFCLFCFCVSLAYSSERYVQLHYIPNLPVVQTSDLKIRMNDLLPGSKIEGEDRQMMQVMLTLLSDQNQPIKQPPVDLLFVLKHFSISVNANNLSEKFVSEAPEKMPHQVQSYQMVDKKLKLHVDESSHIKTENLQALFTEYPALSEIHFEDFLADWFQHLFALAGKNLYVGAVFKLPTSGDQENHLTYEITEITEEEIRANFIETTGSQGLRLSGQISLDGKKQAHPEMILIGETSGQVIWDRKNALIYQVQAKGVVNGNLKIGEVVGP